MKIGELERISGVPRSTLHHYLNIGLLPPPRAEGPKLHLFDDVHLQQLRKIRRLRDRGLSLAAIRERLPAPPPSPALPRTDGHQKHAADPLRKSIRDTAAALFMQEGYEHVQVSDIARAAGIGKATIYRHYPSKAQLFLDCLDELTGNLIAAIVGVPGFDRLSVKEKAERHAAVGLQSFAAYRIILSALGVAAHDKDQTVAKQARVAFHRMATFVEPLLKEAIRQGLLRPFDTEALSFMLFGALLGIGARAAYSEGRHTLEEGLQPYLDFIYNGISLKRPRRRKS